MGLFKLKEPFDKFRTENKEELFQMLKLMLKENGLIDINIRTSQKEDIYKKLNKEIIMSKKHNSIENHKVRSEIMLNDSKLSLVLDTEEKKFELKEVLEYSSGSIELNVKEVQILLEEYAAIILKEKVDYRLEKEEDKEEELEINKKREEDKEFDNFFAV